MTIEQDEATPMCAAVSISRIAMQIEKAERTRLLASLGEAFLEAGVSSVMVESAVHCCHYLEGGAEAVKACLRALDESRHHDEQVLLTCRFIGARHFPESSVAWLQLHPGKQGVAPDWVRSKLDGDTIAGSDDPLVWLQRFWRLE